MSPKPYIVGLTGGIGSGKSTVAKAFIDLGIEVVDADIASRKIVEPGMPALKFIADRFGEKIIKEDGALNRSAMRTIIFSQPREKAWLEHLLHPLIAEWIVDQIRLARSAYVMLESPLLMETHQHKLVDTFLLVDLPEELQLKRASERDVQSLENIQSIMETQMKRGEKLHRATHIFDNTLPKSSIPARVATFHETFLKLANDVN